MAAKGRKFEEDLKELEEVVTRIDSGELSLEQSIAAFERGVALVRALNQKLDEVERKVEVLVKSAQGQLRTVPFDDAAERGSQAEQAGEPPVEGDDGKDEDAPF